MKVLHKLSRISTWLLVLVVFLAGTSISIASTTVEGPVAGFTDVKCRDDAIYFLTMDSMIEHSNADNGWEFNSYVTASNPYECIEHVRAEGTRIPQRQTPSPGAGGGGGGSERPGEQGPVESGPKAHDDIPEELGDTDEKAMKNLTVCWMNKAKEVNLRAILKNGDTGYPYKWADNTTVGKDGEKKLIAAFGATFHDDQVIKLYPTNIAEKSGVEFIHLAVFAALHEWAHFLQAFDRQGRYVGEPTADHWFQNELDAHRLAGNWYRRLFNAEPPYHDFGGSMLPRNLRTDSTYAKNKKTYVKLKNDRNKWQKQLDKPNSNLTTTQKKELREKIANNNKEMEKMEPYFREHANQLGGGWPNDEYEADADLGCIPEETSEDSP